MVRLGSGCIHWSRSLTQSAFLEWEYWWERNPRGLFFFFFSPICFVLFLFLNISNLFLNAVFCFSTISKGRNPKPVFKMFFFFLCGSTTHSSYYPPLPLPLPMLHPLSQIPPKHLGLACSWSQFGFPSRTLSAALIADHRLARQWASPALLCSLLAIVNPGGKKYKEK